MAHGIVERNLGDSPGCSLNVRAGPTRRGPDVERDLDTGVPFGALRKVLEGLDEPERLEDDRPAVGHQPLQLQVDGPKAIGEGLDGSTAFDVGDRPAQRRQHDRMEIAGEADALGVDRGRAGIGFAWHELSQRCPDAFRERRRRAAVRFRAGRGRPDIAGDPERREQEHDIDEQRGWPGRDIDPRQLRVSRCPGDDEEHDDEAAGREPGDQ